MRILLAFVTSFSVTACGASESEVRADERAKILEERVAQLEQEQALATSPSESSAEASSAGESSPASTFTAPENDESIVRGSDSHTRKLIASYDAYIGGADLYNSDGQRLSEPWQVLRQDRANFHRFNIRQNGDQSDRFFASAQNRAIMERMVGNGQIEARAGRRIVDGNVDVRVDIYGNGTVGQSVDVVVR